MVDLLITRPLERHPCWWCRYFDGVTAMNTAALCSCPGCPRVRSDPQHGCCHFTREPGADDVPEWAPPGVPVGPPSIMWLRRGRA